MNNSAPRRRIAVADRVGAAAGAAYILLINVGNQMASGNTQDPHPSGAKDLADFSGTPTAAQGIGFGLEVLGMLCFMFFIGWLVSALRSRGGPWSWLANAAGIGGIVTLAVKLGSVAPIVAGETDHAQLTPTLARVLADMNGASFVTTFLPYSVFLVGASAAMLTAGFSGRVLGISGLVIGLAGIAAPLASHVDPVNTNVFPWVLGMLWTLCAGVRFAVWGPKPPQSSRAGQPESPVPSVAAAV